MRAFSMTIDGLVRKAAASGLLAALLAAGPWGAANAATVRDQGQIFETDGNVWPDAGAFFSQSVTTGITGYLAGIELQYELRGEIQPIQYSIYSGGNPVDGDPLYTELIADPVPDSEGVWRWELPKDDLLLFQAGSQFAFTFEALENGVIFAGNSDPGYGGGELLRNGVLYDPSPDIAFISYVAPIPVPPSIALFLGGFGMLGFAARRRSSK